MKKVVVTLSLLTAAIYVQAQVSTDITNASKQAITKDPADTTNKPWLVGGILNLNGAQTSLNNWAAGGDDYALSINAFANVHAYYKKGKHSWDNALNLNYGYINTTSLGGRKNDDRINLMSRYGYALNPNWDFGALFTFRTQSTKGYTYDSDGARTFSSAFLSPAYVSIGPGFTYHPATNKDFTFYISPATVRWIIVKDKLLNEQGLYGVDSGKSIKTQFGAFASVDYKHDITKTLSYIGHAEVYSDYLDNPQNIYFYMTNMFALKISSVLSATWNFNLIYDDNARLFGPNGNGARLQTQSIIGAGLLYKFNNK
ncbi:MAG: DUF3078 domain-containing protein [Chitinophagaceae bacterium]